MGKNISKDRKGLKAEEQSSFICLETKCVRRTV